jgi:hypothetical protein
MFFLIEGAELLFGPEQIQDFLITLYRRPIWPQDIAPCRETKIDLDIR